MKFLRFLTLSIIIPAAVFVISCGGASDSSEASSWYTDITSGTAAITETGTLSNGDAKVYRLNATSIGYYSMLLSNLSTDCGAALVQYDPTIGSMEALNASLKAGTLESIFADNYNDATSEFSNVQVSTPGYFFLVVYNNSETASSTYSMTLDAGSKTAWYKPLAVGASVKENIAYGGMVFYKVTIATSGTYTFKLTSDKAECVLYGFAYNASDYYISSTASIPFKSANVGEGFSGSIDAGTYIIAAGQYKDNYCDNSSFTLTFSSESGAVNSVEQSEEVNTVKPAVGEFNATESILGGLSTAKNASAWLRK